MKSWMYVAMAAAAGVGLYLVTKKPAAGAPSVANQSNQKPPVQGQGSAAAPQDQNQVAKDIQDANQIDKALGGTGNAAQDIVGWFK